MSARQKIEDKQINQSESEYFDLESDEVKTWEVWSEGFRDGSYHFRAQFHGRFKGQTFQQALQKFGESLPKLAQRWLHINDQMYWGCRLFDNGPAARKRAG